MLLYILIQNILSTAPAGIATDIEKQCEELNINNDHDSITNITEEEINKKEIKRLKKAIMNQKRHLLSQEDINESQKDKSEVVINITNDERKEDISNNRELIKSIYERMNTTEDVIRKELQEIDYIISINSFEVFCSDVDDSSWEDCSTSSEETKKAEGDEAPPKKEDGIKMIKIKA